MENFIMTNYDDYFTNDDKPFSENLNDILLLNNVFDINIPIEMPKMFNNGSFVNNTSPRKCGVSIITLQSSLPSGISINNNGELFGTGTVQLKFYPNFNTFGGYHSITWDENEDITINLKELDGTIIASDIDNGIIESESLELKEMQEIVIEIIFNDAILHNFKVVLQNKVDERYGVGIQIDDIDGLGVRLSNIDNKNSQQGTRLDNIESLDITQNTKLTNMESRVEEMYIYKITPSNYEPKIGSNITVSVEVKNTSGNVIPNQNISLLCTKAKANTFPYENQTTTLTATTNSQGIATFTVNMSNWGIWDFQVSYAHCQVYVDGWRRILYADTYSLYRNQTRAKVILNGVSTSSVTWNWKQFTNSLTAASVRPLHDVVTLSNSGETFIRIDTNGKFWYMVSIQWSHSDTLYAQIEWEICEDDL